MLSLKTKTLNIYMLILNAISLQIGHGLYDLESHSLCTKNTE